MLRWRYRGNGDKINTISRFILWRPWNVVQPWSHTSNVLRMFLYAVWFPESLSSCVCFIPKCFSFLWHFCASHPSCQGCGSLVSVSHSAGALSYRSTEDSSLPEILLGLIYNSATGQLSAEVIKGSHFKTTASNKPVSTYNSFCVEFFFFFFLLPIWNEGVSDHQYPLLQYNSLLKCYFPAQSRQLFWQSC